MELGATMCRCRFWDTAAGQQEPCGHVEVDLAVHDLLQSIPQFSTLMQGKDLANIAGQGKGNRPSQEGGIFGGGCYAAESEREAVSSRNRPMVSNPVAAPIAPTNVEFVKPVNVTYRDEYRVFELPPNPQGGRPHHTHARHSCATQLRHSCTRTHACSHMP